MTLWLQTVIISHQNCGNGELVFLARAITEGRRTPGCKLALNSRRRVLNLICRPALIAYLFPVSSRFVYFVIFSQNWTWLAVRHRTACFLTRYNRFSNTEHPLQKWFMQFKQVSFSCSKSKTNTYLPALLLQRIKTSCVRMTKIGNVQNSAELWVKINLFNVFCNICIRFGTWKSSTYEIKWIFCPSIRKPGRTER